MTKEQIEAKRAQANLPFNVAKQIRELLDKAAEAYGREEWEADDCEAKVQSLVFDEE